MAYVKALYLVLSEWVYLIIISDKQEKINMKLGAVF